MEPTLRANPAWGLQWLVHVPTFTTIYIDAGDTDETRTIMRAELVAIYTALDKFAAHE